MGTHPIFESDFDCLTAKKCFPVSPPSQSDAPQCNEVESFSAPLHTPPATIWDLNTLWAGSLSSPLSLLTWLSANFLSFAELVLLLRKTSKSVALSQSVLSFATVSSAKN